MNKIAFVFCLAVSAAATATAATDESASFFNSTSTGEIRLYFDDSSWYNTLYQGHASNSEDPYFPARVLCGETSIAQIGARFKGNSSFQRNGVKKSFKLSFNEYSDDATCYGLKKLNLNNGDLQPDFLREKLFLDFASNYITAMRSTHVRLYVNDTYYGLYLAVEQPDKVMMKNRFGKSEDGNLYEAAESNATLAYLGTNASSYTSLYELKTNETANDYSGLIEMLNILNNTESANLPTALEEVMDVENVLYGMALNNLFTNLESYVGAASEFYLYDRTSDGKFIHLHWDLNESFGTTGDGTPSLSNPFTMDPFYLPTSTTAGSGTAGGGKTGGQGGGTTAPTGGTTAPTGGTAPGTTTGTTATTTTSSTSTRPLLEKLWAVNDYKRLYLQMLAKMLRDGFNSTAMQTRIDTLANRIRSDYNSDPNKPFTSTQFETALASQTTVSNLTVYGLSQFVTNRYASLRTLLDSYSLPADLRLNEVVMANSGTQKDTAGDADPWIELYNLGPGTISTNGYYLTDDASNPTKWALPSRSLADGDYLVIWLDNETSEGELHASFRPATSGGTIYLYNSTTGTSTALDSVQYGALTAGQSYARKGNYGTKWAVTETPTAGAANTF